MLTQDPHLLSGIDSFVSIRRGMQSRQSIEFYTLSLQQYDVLSSVLSIARSISFCFLSSLSISLSSELVAMLLSHKETSLLKWRGKNGVFARLLDVVWECFEQFHEWNELNKHHHEHTWLGNKSDLVVVCYDQYDGYCEDDEKHNDLNLIELM